MSQLFESCNEDFDRKQDKKNILKKALFDGPSENLRPLYNINLAKVPIVKMSQILTSTARSSISGIPKIVNNFSF